MAWVSQRSAQRLRRRRLAQALVLGTVVLVGGLGVWAAQRAGDQTQGQVVAAGVRAEIAQDLPPEESSSPSTPPTPATAPEASNLIQLPQVAGLLLPEALAALEAAGLTGVSDQPQYPAEQSLVSMTDPTAGTLIEPGTEVRLSVQSIVPDPTPTYDLAPVAYTVLAENFATADTSTDFLTEVARNADELAALLLALDLREVGPVNFDTSVVLYFATVQSSSCPLAPLVSLVYRADDSRIYPVTQIAPIAEPNWVCNADAQSHGTLLSVPRTDLPRTDFTLWIDALRFGDADPRICCADPQQVSVDGLLLDGRD